MARTEDEVRNKIKALHRDLKKYRAATKSTASKKTPRRQKREILGDAPPKLPAAAQQVKDKHTAPFIDDLVVNPPYLVEFLPQIQKIIKKYKLFATIAGPHGRRQLPYSFH